MAGEGHMGWRADKAYEEAQAKAFQEWRASLNRMEYFRWQWDRHRHFLSGVVVAGIVALVIWWLTKT
jgi:hypothetical protein